MTAYQSNQNGDWNTSTVWTPNGVPGSGDSAQCSHNITISTIDAVIDALTVDSLKTLIMSNSYSLTGMTASVLGAGEITLGPGSDLKWNSASALTLADVSLVTRGTSGNRCQLENVGAGGLTWSSADTGDFDCEYIDILGITSAVFGGHNVQRFIDADFIGSGTSSYILMGYQADIVFLDRVWISNFGHALGWAPRYTGPNTPNNQIHMTNITLGESRDGTANDNGNDIHFENAKGAGRLYLRNAQLLSAGGISMEVRPEQYIHIDNYGYNPHHTTTGSPGAWFTEGSYFAAQRSTSNPKSGETYHARVTPKSGCGDDEWKNADINIWVPVLSGDDIDVSVYGYNFGLTPASCAEVIIDPEGALYTSASASPSFTDSTWVEANPSASSASATGTVHVVLRVKEYVASKYFDWSKVVITTDNATYTVSHQHGESGMPIADAPAGGAPNLFGGLYGKA
jgi:hypothetical protein